MSPAHRNLALAKALERLRQEVLGAARFRQAILAFDNSLVQQRMEKLPVRQRLAWLDHLSMHTLQADSSRPGQAISTTFWQVNLTREIDPDFSSRRPQVNKGTCAVAAAKGTVPFSLTRKLGQSLEN
jgi:hypothetical protein